MVTVLDSARGCACLCVCYGSISNDSGAARLPPLKTCLEHLYVESIMFILSRLGVSPCGVWHDFVTKIDNKVWLNT